MDWQALVAHGQGALDPGAEVSDDAGTMKVAVVMRAHLWFHNTVSF